MNKLIITTLSLLLVTFSVHATQLDTSPMRGILKLKALCLNYTYVEKNLAKEGEKKTLTLLAKNKDLIEIWVNHEADSWTIISRSAKLKTGCVLIVGHGIFQVFGQTL